MKLGILPSEETKFILMSHPSPSTRTELVFLILGFMTVFRQELYNTGIQELVFVCVVTPFLQH